MAADSQPEKKHSCASGSSSESKPKMSYEETYKREAETARHAADDLAVKDVETSQMRVEIAKPPFWMKTDGLEAKKGTVDTHPLLKENKKCKLNPVVFCEVTVVDPITRRGALEGQDTSPYTISGLT